MEERRPIMSNNERVEPFFLDRGFGGVAEIAAAARARSAEGFQARLSSSMMKPMRKRALLGCQR